MGKEMQPLGNILERREGILAADTKLMNRTGSCMLSNDFSMHSLPSNKQLMFCLL